MKGKLHWQDKKECSGREETEETEETEERKTEDRRQEPNAPPTP